jgi:hypothetical protein
MKISKKSVASSSFGSDMQASRKHQVFFVSRSHALRGNVYGNIKNRGSRKH